MSRCVRHTLLLLVIVGLTGCQAFDYLSPSKWQRMNRGENYMNDDGFYSIPVAVPPSIPPTDSPR